MIDVQRRVAAEVMAPIKAELKARDAKIAELEQRLMKTGSDVAASSFEQKLAVAVPNFSSINASPEWVAWLDEPDLYTGEPRRAFAEFAYSNGDVEKVKRVVDAYLKTTTPPPEQTERQQRQAELERQVTPSRSSASSTPAQPANARIYTEAQMVKLFNQVRVLNVAGKQDEASKLEAELSDAYMQGRVRG